MLRTYRGTRLEQRAGSKETPMQFAQTIFMMLCIAALVAVLLTVVWDMFCEDDHED